MNGWTDGCISGCREQNVGELMFTVCWSYLKQGLRHYTAFTFTCSVLCDDSALRSTTAMTENLKCRVCGPVRIMPLAFCAFLVVYEASTIMHHCFSISISI